MRPPSIPTPATGSGPLSQTFSGVFTLLEEAIRDRAFPGASLCVSFRQNVLLNIALGRFTYDAGSPAVSPSTAYDLASLTKVLAGAAAAMLLYERGSFHLDKPVVDVLPAFDIPADLRRRRVTLAMLLSHSSGLPSYARLYQQAQSRQELISLALKYPLASDPGTRAEYSDLGFIVLTAALEKLAAERIDTFCARELFLPMGLPDLRYCPPASMQDRIPPAEDDRDFRKAVIQGVVQDENAFVMDGVSAHAGLFGSAADVTKFGESMLRSLSGEAPFLFRRETVELFTRRNPELDASHALGWDTPSHPSSSGKYFSPRSFGHLGFSGTSLWIDPEKQLTVTLLTNRCWPSRENQKLRQVRPLVHDAIIEALGLAAPLTKE